MDKEWVILVVQLEGKYNNLLFLPLVLTVAMRWLPSTVLQTPFNYWVTNTSTEQFLHVSKAFECTQTYQTISCWIRHKTANVQVMGVQLAKCT